MVWWPKIHLWHTAFHEFAFVFPFCSHYCGWHFQTSPKKKASTIDVTFLAISYMIKGFQLNRQLFKARSFHFTIFYLQNLPSSRRIATSLKLSALPNSSTSIAARSRFGHWGSTRPASIGDPGAPTFPLGPSWLCGTKPGTVEVRPIDHPPFYIARIVSQITPSKQTKTKNSTTNNSNNISVTCTVSVFSVQSRWSFRVGQLRTFKEPWKKT